ncbi:hypothetical protein VPH35_115586 [Triticum aestivum]|nr:uncharacterized protein LOC109736496 [Aegilops tauschii subsp. strangulata]
MYDRQEKGKVQGAWRFILQGRKESNAVLVVVSDELRVFIPAIFVPSFANLLPSSHAGHELHMNHPPLQHKKASSPSTEATPELQILVRNYLTGRLQSCHSTNFAGTPTTHASPEKMNHNDE